MATTTTKSENQPPARHSPGASGLAADAEQHRPRGPGRGHRVSSARTSPILTQSRKVAAFEQEWSAWLGVKHSVFVNSGSSANLLTMAALREPFGRGEVIVPTLTWVSDIASVLQCGFKPVFVDINPRTLGMDDQASRSKSLTPQTRAVFLTHVLGYNALDPAPAGRIRRREHPAHRGCLRVARRDFQGPQARHVRSRCRTSRSTTRTT